MMNKEETRKFMGYQSIDSMDRDHDPLHREMADHFGVTSWSMADAVGIPLTPEQQTLAWAEENAVLHTQRWLRMAGKYDG